MQTADALPGTRAASGQGPERTFENMPDKVPTDMGERDDHIGEKDDIEVAVVHEKSKPSAGFMLEQRVLVTATPQNSETTVPNADVDEQNSPEPCDIPRIETIDVDDEYPFERTTSEPEPEPRETSAPVCATPELEHSTLDSPIPAVTPGPVLDEPFVFEPTVVAEDVQSLQKAAPAGLLNLPTGMWRMPFYQEAANIAQRSGT
jgi:hypothetical protein